MRDNKGASASSILFGTQAQVGVGRGLAEFRAGRPVVISSSGEILLCLPVEGLDKSRLAAFRALCAPIVPRLVLTGLRARSLGIESSEPVAIEMMADVDASEILTLSADAIANQTFLPEPAGKAAGAAIELVKLAQILPAVLVADTTAEATG
jgi:GTP cyclohydrolase II